MKLNYLYHAVSINPGNLDETYMYKLIEKQETYEEYYL